MPEITFALGPVTLIAIALAIVACAVLLWPNRNQARVEDVVDQPPQFRPGQDPENSDAEDLIKPDNPGPVPKNSEHRGTFAQKQEPDPPPDEQVVGPYMVLRVTNPTRPLSSILYPMLRGDAQPTLWAGERIERDHERIDDLGRGLDGRLKRTGTKGRVVCTNRRLIAWSRDNPPRSQGWRQAPDTRGRFSPGNRLMAHILWEWVKEVRITSSTGDGHTVEIRMDTSKVGYETASLLLTFGQPADTAEQRAQVFADNVVSLLNDHGIQSHKDGKTYTMSRHTPVPDVTWWDR